LTRPEFHRLDFFEKFHRLISDPPLPHFSQRDGLEIDDQQELDCLNKRNIARLGTFEYLIDLPSVDRSA
jgi:hypothetical protein